MENNVESLGLVGLLTDDFEHAINIIQARALDMDEAEIRRKISITPTLDNLRLAFWREAERAFMEKRKIKFKNVYSNICSRQHFYDIMHEFDQEYPAYILKKPSDYGIEIEKGLRKSITVLNDALSKILISVDAGGELNSDDRSYVERMYKTLHEIMHGKAIQRTESKVQQVPERDKIEDLSLEDLEKRAKELREKHMSIIDVK